MDVLEEITADLFLPEWDDAGNLIFRNNKSKHHLAAVDFKRWFKNQLISGNIKPEEITDGPFNFLPNNVKNRIYKKIKRGKSRKITNEDLKLITGLDFSQTSKITREMHQVFNYIFGGNASPPTVLKILNIFLKDNYYSNYSYFNKKRRISPIKKREHFLWFFNCVARYKGKEIELEKINELAEKDLVVIKFFLPFFKISKKDIKEFLDEYFLYYNYERHMDFWKMVERKGFSPSPGKSVADEVYGDDVEDSNNDGVHKYISKIKKHPKKGKGGISRTYTKLDF